MNIKLGIAFLSILFISIFPEKEIVQQPPKQFMPDFKGRVYVFNTQELNFYAGGLMSNAAKQVPVEVIQNEEQYPWVQIIDGQYTYWLNLNAPSLIYREYTDE